MSQCHLLSAMILQSFPNEFHWFNCDLADFLLLNHSISFKMEMRFDNSNVCAIVDPTSISQDVVDVEFLDQPSSSNHNGSENIRC